MLRVLNSYSHGVVKYCCSMRRFCSAMFTNVSGSFFVSQTTFVLYAYYMYLSNKIDKQIPQKFGN